MASNSNFAHETNEWRGYTIDELRYRRALNQVKTEMARERIVAGASAFTDFSANGLLPRNKFWGKLLSGFSMLDYGIMAYQGAKRIVSIYRLFKRK
jgi:hypothetical protein